MKIAFFGMDALIDCLDTLQKSGCEIVSVFTFPGDDFDRTEKTRAFAATHNIPCKITRVTKADIRALEEAGVSCTITAGYPYLIPVSETIKQVNIHPSMLPLGRGPWPMPTCILKNISSGVTLHKLAKTFDTGDILLQKEIPLDPKENLETLYKKVANTANQLLKQFLTNPDHYWANATIQQTGEYWPEPTDLDRTILPTDDEETIDRKMRAFKGYGCLKKVNHILMQINAVHTVYPYFRPITLADLEKMEAIRKAYPSDLCDFTFPLLYCWQETLDFSVYLEDTFFLIKGKDHFFAPIGNPDDYTPFLQSLRALYPQIIFDFCDEDHMNTLLSIFPKATATLKEDGCDYVISRETITTLEGRKLKDRRNDLKHYSTQEPVPEVEMITPENLHHVYEVAAVHHKEDFYAQNEALNVFKKLHLQGILVKRGDSYVSFAIGSEKSETVLQGHFMKSIDPARGASLFAARACLLNAPKKYEYLNMEDDMGDTGVRHFKQSLYPEVIPSYTVTVQ